VLLRFPLVFSHFSSFIMLSINASSSTKKATTEITSLWFCGMQDTLTEKLGLGNKIPWFKDNPIHHAKDKWIENF
jgi:hypothetical protein